MAHMRSGRITLITLTLLATLGAAPTLVAAADDPPVLKDGAEPCGPDGGNTIQVCEIDLPQCADGSRVVRRGYRHALFCDLAPRQVLVERNHPRRWTDERVEQRCDRIGGEFRDARRPERRRCWDVDHG